MVVRRKNCVWIFLSRLLSDMEKNPPPQTAEQQALVATRRFSVLKLLLTVLLVLCTSFILLLAWAIKTQSGTQVLFSFVHYLTAGSLQTTGIKGSIGDDLELDQLSFHSSTIKLDASGVHLVWQPSALWHEQVLIDRLHVTSLRIATKSDQSPTSLPQQLALPLDLSAKDIALGQLLIAEFANHVDVSAQPEPLKFSAISGQLNFAQGRYQTVFSLNSPWGRVKTNTLSLDAHRPFVLKADATLQGQVVQDIPAVNVALNADGSLQELKLRLKAQFTENQQTQDRQSTLAILNGHANATLTPFAPQLLKQLDVDVQHLNPAAWSASAPSADLRVVASGHPDFTQKNKTDNLTGELHATNAQVNSLDQNGLPVRQIDAQYLWQGSQLNLTNLRVLLAGDGTAKGGANIAWHAAQPSADVRIALSNVDLLQIDQHLRHTKVSGEVTAKTTAQQQITLQAQLHDVGTQLNTDLNYDIRQQLLAVRQINLVSQESHVEGQGEMSFAGNQAFHFKGTIANFDPAKWLAVPSGHLQADLNASGQLLPSVSIAASMPHFQGQYAGQMVQGNFDLQWRAQQIQLHQFDLRWGSNHLNAQGAWGGINDAMKIQVEAPQLSEFNSVLASQHIALNGDLKGNILLQGQFSEPAGLLNIQSEKLQITQAEQQYSLQKLAGKVSLSRGSNGVFEGELSASHIRSAANSVADPDDKIEQVTLSMKGQRAAHDITMQVQFPGQQNVSAKLSGGLRTVQLNKENSWGWVGQLQSLLLNGQADGQLTNPTAISVSPQAVHVGGLHLNSNLASISLEQLDWTPQALKTQGKVAGVKVTELLNFFRPQYAVTGSLKLNADWNIQLAESVRGEINIQKQSGDLRFNDPDGTGTPIPLGIRDLQAKLTMGGLVAGTDGQRLNLMLDADGTRLGQLHLQANSLLSRQNGQWRLASSAPLVGKVTAVLPDLEWVGAWINPGLVLKGKLNLDANLSGTLASPHYHADIAARELELAFASEGLLLPNGLLDAQIDDAHLKLTRLQFSNTVTVLPQHEQFRGWDALGKRGEFNASGELDIGTETGSIKAEWQQFPMLQRKDRWLQISGQASIVEANNIWSLTGKVSTDGAYFKLPKLPPPSLSSDVNVIRKKDKFSAKNGDASVTKKGLKTRVDVSFDMGSRFVFVGRGLDTSLAGSLRLRSIDGSPLQATGTINTVKGSYEGYGQQLTILRGILNFQGPPANPGLNIRALRQGLPVEAGVEVVGTVVAPQVRLVSEPDVPDTEKLTWLVLGRGSDQLAGGDASLLMSAASAIFGGDGSRNVPKDIVQGLGFDEFSIGSASGALSSHVPGQTVAGATSTSTSTTNTTDQVVSVGKHLMPGLVLAVERGLGDGSGAVKLSWQLTRRITVVGRTGSESAVDINYTFSFN